MEKRKWGTEKRSESCKSADASFIHIHCVNALVRMCLPLVLVFRLVYHTRKIVIGALLAAAKFILEWMRLTCFFGTAGKGFGYYVVVSSEAQSAQVRHCPDSLPTERFFTLFLESSLKNCNSKNVSLADTALK